MSRHTTCAFCTPAYVVLAGGRWAARRCIVVARREESQRDIHACPRFPIPSSPTRKLTIYHIFSYTNRKSNCLIVAQPHGSLRPAMTFLGSIQQYGGFRGGGDQQSHAREMPSRCGRYPGGAHTRIHAHASRQATIEASPAICLCSVVSCTRLRWE